MLSSFSDWPSLVPLHPFSWRPVHFLLSPLKLLSLLTLTSFYAFTVLSAFCLYPPNQWGSPSRFCHRCKPFPYMLSELKTALIIQYPLAVFHSALWIFSCWPWHTIVSQYSWFFRPDSPSQGEDVGSARGQHVWCSLRDYAELWVQWQSWIIEEEDWCDW